MLKTEFRKSIRYKFLRTLSIVLLMGTVVLSTVIALNEREMLKQSLMSKGQGLASFMANLSQDPLIMKDNVQLDSLVHDANKDGDILYSIIEDAQGVVVTSQYSSINFTTPRMKSMLAGLTKDDELHTMISAIHAKEAVTTITVPIVTGTDTIGRVTICLSQHAIRNQIVKTVLFVIALNLLVTAVLGAVLFISSKKSILDPIRELGRATDRLAKGDLSTQVSLETSGEIRTLVDNFNQMAANLDKTTVSKNYLDEIISSMSDTLIVLAPDRTITQVNTAASALLGYHESELVGRPIDLVIQHKEDTKSGPLSAVFDQGARSVNSVDMTYLTKQGKEIPMLFSASVMRGSHGEVQGVVCVARDITEIKKAEDKLKESTREIQEMYDELKTFSYIASHDLRAPLVNIRGFSDELLHGIWELGPTFVKFLNHAGEGERQKFSQIIEQDIPEALKYIDLSVNRMSTLINALLKLSHIDRRSMHLEPILTEEMVRGILKTMTHQIESRKTSVIVGKLPNLIADKTATEQIFGNLLDNAIKYLDPARPGEIAITAEPGNGEVVFHIRDNGRGMSSEDIPRAFEIFRRMGTQDVPGEGMGLAFVKTSIRMLGGRIWCESEPGKGTTFSISFPSRRSEELVEHAPSGGQ